VSPSSLRRSPGSICPSSAYLSRSQKFYNYSNILYLIYFSIFKAEGSNMPEKAVLKIRLVPEAVKVKASLIKQDIQKEFKNIVRAIPWAAEIEDIQVE